MNKSKEERKTWEYPWRYKESFFIVLEIILLGLIFEVLTAGRGAKTLHWPVNLFIGLGILAIIILLHIFFKKHPIIKWLSSVPAAISAISFFAFVVLLLGFIPQDDLHAHRVIRLLGLTHVKNSWLMLLSGLYFLVTLGFVALRRSTPFTRKNIGFLLNHAGLWITIAAGYLGSGDLLRVHMTVGEEQGFSDIAFNAKTREEVKLPFALKLKDFRIDDYNPKMAIFDGRNGEMINEDGKSIIMIEKGMKANLMGWQIEVLDFTSDAYKKGKEYYPADSVGAAPAALVHVVHTDSGKEINGWISCGSYWVRHQYLPVDQHNFLVMTIPEPEKYASDIVFKNQEGETIDYTLEVNKPYSYSGWKLYQLSYDEQMGKWSNVSVIEAVKDPWLPAVYTGFFLLLAGALYLFWIGREIKEK